MDNELDLQKKFNSLPEELKNAITSVDFANSLQEIGKIHGLHIDQLDQLFEEVGYVLLGITHPTEFGPKIGKLFNLPEVAKNNLVKAVDEKIFKPIRTSLMSLYSKQKNNEQGAMNKEPALVAETQTQKIPHENESAMSRETILSEIENPITPKPSLDANGVYIPKRNVETSNPHEYLEQRSQMIERMKAAPVLGSGVPKKSLAEEAIVVAQKKVGQDAPLSPKKPDLNPSPVILQKTAPAPLKQPEPITPVSPLEKLSNVVRVPRQSVTIGSSSANSQTKTDPYRESL